MQCENPSEGLAMSETTTEKKRSEASPLTGIAAFAVKTCIVGVVITACAIFAADWVVDNLQVSVLTTIATIHDEMASTTVGGHQFWDKVARELDRAADPSTDLPPEKKEKLLRDVRVIVARYRPFIEAAQKGWQDPASGQ
jgi:hypothetical protein